MHTASGVATHMEGALYKDSHFCDGEGCRDVRMVVEEVGMIERWTL